MSQLDELLSQTTNSMTVKRVYGEPYQSNGVTVIPAAAVRGGLGGGEGEGSEDTPAGRGGGMGVSVRPIGVYQIQGDKVSWVPAVDVSKIVIVTQMVAIVALLVLRSVMRRPRG
jgi:uncharacterized spore protein YtfJ